jgi:hypothetical protein
MIYLIVLLVTTGCATTTQADYTTLFSIGEAVWYILDAVVK